MSDAIDRALQFWWDAETDPRDPHKAHTTKGDPGGLTKYGIASKFHPAVDFATLDWPGAQRLLRSAYWIPNRCDVIAEFAPLTAWALFDFCANGHAPAARELLQKVVGVPQDGRIGPVTLVALRGANDLKTAQRLTRERLKRQFEIATDPGLVKGLALRFHDLMVALSEAA